MAQPDCAARAQENLALAPASAGLHHRIALEPRAGQKVLSLQTVSYQKKPTSTTHIVMSPLEFMQRLAALVPHLRLDLIHFHGGFAPNARLCLDIIPKVPVNANTPSADHDEVLPPMAPAPVSWARLLTHRGGVAVVLHGWLAV